MFEFMRISLVLALTGILAPFILLGAWFVIIFAPILLSAMLVLVFPLFLALLVIKLPELTSTSRAGRKAVLVIDDSETERKVAGSVSNVTPKYRPAFLGVR